MNGLQPETFLQDCWQKQPLFLRQAVPGGLPTIDRDELAWLATLEDVESRLVFTERGERVTYRVEHGPFTEDELRRLPDRDWTLLVNDVEKHLPELRPFVDIVDFVPDWRLDDLMVSFAARGGGVGPHRDNYDVFLCQVSGRREWLVTADDVETDPDACKDLALLQPFEAQAWTGEPGDLLYLPPGVPHWGTALDPCLTYSIGMRAPRRSDLQLGERTLDPDAFYGDPDLSLDEVRPGYISPQAVARVTALLPAGIDRDEAARRLGCCVTANKDWLRPDGLAAPPGPDLRLHGMARLAWDEQHVYLNGACRRLQPGEAALVRHLCRERSLASDNLPSFGPPQTTAGLVRWLAAHGGLQAAG